VCKKRHTKYAVMVFMDVMICSLVARYCFRGSIASIFNTELKMAAINSHETLVPMYQSTQCNIPADYDPSAAVSASNLIQVTDAWLGVISAHSLHSIGEAPVSTD
jgi:hypothetical protein